MRDILEGLAEILESVRGMLSGPAPLEGLTGAGVLALINDSLELLEEIAADAPHLAGEVAWLRRRFFGVGVALEDLTPSFEYSTADRITRRPVLGVVDQPRKLTPSPAQVNGRDAFAVVPQLLADL